MGGEFRTLDDFASRMGHLALTTPSMCVIVRTSKKQKYMNSLYATVGG